MRTQWITGLGEPLNKQAVSDWTTQELLVLVLDGSAGVDVVDAVAGSIDAGMFASALEPQDKHHWSHGDTAPATATRLTAAFELARRAAAPKPPDIVRGPSDVAAIACRQIGGLHRERVIAIVCDAANRPLRTVVVSDGTIDRSLLPVREILNAALRLDGRAFAVAHNHPCGNPAPSAADVAATHRISEAARVVGLRCLGHVVVGEDRWATVAT